MTDPDNSTSKIDRLPVFVSGKKGDELLGIPKLLTDLNYHVNTEMHSGTCVCFSKMNWVKNFYCSHVKNIFSNCH